MVEFADVVQKARQQGQVRSDYAAACHRRFQEIREALAERVRAGGGVMTVTPEGNEPKGGVLTADVEIKFPNELTFDQNVTRMESPMGVKVYLNSRLFEFTCAGGTFTTESVEEAVDAFLRGLMQVMEDLSKNYMGL